MKFSHEEIQLINDCIAFRNNKLNGDLKHTKLMDSIFNKINFPSTNLTMSQRSLLSGCIKDYAINPTKELNQLSDYEILLSDDKHKNEFKKMDLGYEVLNKLMKRGEKKNSLFKTTVETIMELINSKTTYYSINSDNNIYKIGIVTGKSLGLQIRLDGPSIENDFEINSLFEQSFMKVCSPKEVLEIIRENIKGYRNSRNLTIALAILEKSCTSE